MAADDQSSPADSAGDLEIAVAAAQARTNIARVRDFTSFQPEDEIALDRVMALLGGMAALPVIN